MTTSTSQPPAADPQVDNLVDLYQRSVARCAERPAFGVLRGKRWEWVTYGRFAALVDNLRSALAGLGIGRGDRVAVIADNCLQWVVAAHATYQRRAIFVPMYEAQGDGEWRFILADSGAKLCFVANAAIASRVEGLREDLLDLQHIVNLGLDQPGQRGVFEDLLDQGATRAIKPRNASASDVATIIYTSGTTGEPKGVRVTQGNLAFQAETLSRARDYGERPTSMAFLPWAHVFGGGVELNVMLALGGRVAICRNADQLFAEVANVRPTILYAVPRIWNRVYYDIKRELAEETEMTRNLFDNGLRLRERERRGESLKLTEKISLNMADRLIISKLKARLGGRLRFGFSGAAPLSPEVAHYLRSLGANVLEGYGLTESTGSAATNPADAPRDGSVGRALPGTHVSIDTGVLGTAGQVGEHTIGEIVIEGPSVMAGYHNRPEDTAAVLTERGALRTGDLGYLDQDGYLYITGRLKELYKLNSGRYVAPVPLEEKLKLSPFISQCMVYGAGQAYNVALLVADLPALRAHYSEPGRSDDELLVDPRTRRLFEDEVLKYSRDFRTFELVRNFWLVGDAFSQANGMLTPTLKPRRELVLARYEAQLLSLY